MKRPSRWSVRVSSSSAMPRPIDHAAQDLAARGLRVQDLAGGHRIDDARDAHDAQLLVDLDLGEHGRVGVGGIFRLHALVRAGRFLGLDPVDPAGLHRLARTSPPGPARCARRDPAAGEGHVLERGVRERRVVDTARMLQQLAPARRGRRPARPSRPTPPPTSRLRPAISAATNRRSWPSRPPCAGPARRRRSGSGWCRCRCRCRRWRWRPRACRRSVSTARAVVCIISASQTPVAMPQPTSSRPSRIERGCGLALRPAEPRRTLRVAGAQLLAGERLALVLVGLGVVPEPQLERVDAGAVGELVHGRLEPEHARGWRRVRACRKA